MRLALILLASLFSPMAQAQSVVNGDFELGLSNWTDASSSSCGWCIDGSASVVDEAAAGLSFPSAQWALYLTTGDDDGGSPTFGSVESDAFLVTWESVEWEHHAVSDEQDVEVLLFDTVSGNEVAGQTVTPSVGAFALGGMDVAAACGRTAMLVIYAEPNFSGWGDDDQETYWDNVVLSGNPCPDYVDGDGDGYCVGGVDLDGSGDCASDGEPDPYVSDCDDGDAALNPGAVDVPGNGVDENCDGLDATGTTPGTTSTGGTTTGSGGTTSTGTSTGTSGTTTAGTGTGGSATGGSTTGVGTGTTTGTTGGTTSGDGFQEGIVATGAGCACDANSGGMNLVWLLLLPLARLRRQDD